MSVVLMSRTVVLGGWLLALIWHGVGTPAAVAIAVLLPVLWVAAYLRDSRPYRNSRRYMSMNSP